PDVRVARVYGQIANDNGFTDVVDEWHHGAGHGSHRYAVPQADTGNTFYVRIRAEDDAANVGNWQPSNTGHALVGEADEGLPDPPGVPTSVGIAFDVFGTRHSRYRALVTPAGSTGLVDHYVIQFAHNRTDGGLTPPAGTRR